MKMFSKKKKKKKVKWYVRGVFYVGLMLMCAIVGAVGAPYAMPFWDNLAASLNDVPVVGEGVSKLHPGHAFFAAAIAIVLSQVVATALKTMHRASR